MNRLLAYYHYEDLTWDLLGKYFVSPKGNFGRVVELRRSISDIDLSTIVWVITDREQRISIPYETFKLWTKVTDPIEILFHQI